MTGPRTGSRCKGKGALQGPNGPKALVTAGRWCTAPNDAGETPHRWSPSNVGLQASTGPYGPYGLYRPLLALLGLYGPYWPYWACKASNGPMGLYGPV